MTITNSTISGNSARRTAAASTTVDGTLTITNSTISGNSATNEGGGIYNPYGTVTITDSTIAGNSAGVAAAASTMTTPCGATTTLSNTIVADNTVRASTSPDISGTVTANYCLIEDTTGTTFTSSSANNITGVDPTARPAGR